MSLATFICEFTFTDFPEVNCMWWLIVTELFFTGERSAAALFDLKLWTLKG